MKGESMQAEVAAIMISILGAGVSVGAVVFGAGKQAEKVAAVEKKIADQGNEIKTLATKEQLKGVVERACEDREHDDKRIEELFLSRNELQNGLVELTASMNAVCDRLGRIEPKLDRLLERGAVNATPK
jgi:hypothetical protein